MAEPNITPTQATATQRTLLRRLAAGRLRRAELIYLAAFTAFAVLAVCAHLYTYFGWDARVAIALQQLPVPGLFNFMRAVSYPGNRWHPFALTTATVLVLLWRRRRTEAAGLTLSVAGGSLINFIVKQIVARPRPAALVSIYKTLPSKSFPSGHVTFYVCYFGFLFFVAYAVLPRDSWARRLALALLPLPILLVGLSRVYLGAHWPSDALGAYLLSGLWLATALHFYRKWKQRSTFHPEDKAAAQADDVSVR